MIRKLALFIAFVAVSGLVWVGTAHATGMKSGETVLVGKEEVVDASLYGAGKTITIAGTVRGDVYCAGQTIDISGTVEGDVLCAGQEIRLTGRVMGDVRLAGQNVIVSGTVDRGASLLGQSVSIERAAVIGRDATLAGQTTYAEGKIGRDLVAAGEVARVSSQIGRDVTLAADTTHLKSEAKIARNLTYVSDQKIQIDRGAVVSGTTTHQLPEAHKKAKPQTHPIIAWLTGTVYWFLMFVAAGLVLWFLAPKWLHGTDTFMRQKIWLAGGLGFASLLLAPILAVVLIVTVIGIPLALGLLALWAFLVFLSFVAASFTIGRWIMGRVGLSGKSQDLVGLLAGSGALVLLMAIPWIGGLITVLALLWGLGGLTLAIHQTLRRQQAHGRAK